MSDPFYVAYKHAAAEGRDDRLCTNFRLLQLQGVHEAISRTLLMAQLRYDQFLTTRTILDFLHTSSRVLATCSTTCSPATAQI